MKHSELSYTMDWIMISNLTLGIEIIALQWGSKDYPLHLVLLMKLDLIEDFLQRTFFLQHTVNLAGSAIFCSCICGHDVTDNVK